MHELKYVPVLKLWANKAEEIISLFNFTKIKTTTSFDLTSDQNIITPMLNKDNKEQTTQKLKKLMLSLGAKTLKIVHR